MMGPAVGAERDVVAAAVVAAIDQHVADAARHFVAPGLGAVDRENGAGKAGQHSADENTLRLHHYRPDADRPRGLASGSPASPVHEFRDMVSWRVAPQSG